ncbi:MAG: TRAP transporter small permease [Albidovulum sp.]|nr:TRAP transporter small permease [Albidovulum sp.]MDE0530592.1 TRAP transporter small permease [Albidovulum sp.]
MSQSEVRQKSRILSALLSLAAYSIFLISVLMVVVTLAQVVFRYVIAAPLPWSEELARYCFVWIVFLGGAIGLSRGIHLGVDLFVNLLPDRFRPGLEALSNAFIAVFAATVVYASYPVINMNMLQRSPALGVQMSWIYIAIPISMCLIFLICLERIVAILRASREQKG